MTLVIGLCIGFLIGNISGIILMALMQSASRDSREREALAEMEADNEH